MLTSILKTERLYGAGNRDEVVQSLPVIRARSTGWHRYWCTDYDFPITVYPRAITDDQRDSSMGLRSNVGPITAPSRDAN